MRVQRIRSKRLREQQFKTHNVWSLESKMVKWNGVSDVERMGEQVKRVVLDSAREMCVFVWVKKRNSKVVVE